MQLITALQKRGYDFTVITSHDGLSLPDEECYKGISIYRFPFQSVLSHCDLDVLKAVRQHVTRIKRIIKPDIVHINSLQPSVFFYQHTENIYPAPMLMTVHSPFYTSTQNSLLGRMLNSAQWIVTVSEAILQDVRQLVPDVSSRSSVIYNGLPMPRIEPTPLPIDEPRILCLGRLIKEKGFDVALDAFGRIIHRFPQARLVIAGDGPARSDLEAQASRLGLKDMVAFIGWVIPEKIPELINTATLVVMPSRWREPFGLVALQAAQMARPIVATRVGGLSEVVTHHRTGLLAEKEDNKALAEHMSYLLRYPEKARQMGQAARKRSRDLFGMERFVNDYDAIYKRVGTVHPKMENSTR